MSIWWTGACISGVVCVLLTSLASRSSGGAQGFPEGFKAHQRRYLIAWGLGISGEWFCGPGVYALYASYGFTHAQTAQLFVLGFVASSVLGLFAGQFADRFGRKRAAMLYCCAGVVACSAKHVPWLPALYFGRLFDGLHASLLYTAFESWLVAEHIQHHGFPPELLGHTFGLMYRVSYFSAIFCGFIAQRGVDDVPMFTAGGVHFGRWGVPLELSAFFQILCFIYIGLNWDENYGQASESSPEGQTNGKMRKICAELMRPQVLVCGIMVAFFESALFIFVFSWTPALAPNGDKSALPCGLIFAVYMMNCLSGASFYSIVSRGIAKTMRLGTRVFAIICIAGFGIMIPAVMSVSEDTVACNFLGFMIFEFGVGAYFPSAGALKSELVEEAHRTTIYNVFRTPMNLIVIGVLLLTPDNTLLWRFIFTGLVITATALGLFVAFDKRRPVIGEEYREPLLSHDSECNTPKTSLH